MTTAPRRWLSRVWGVADIHARQKWSAVWPLLAQLPTNGLRVLDAGCGTGEWTLEIAVRRPGWQVVGLDHAEHPLQEARNKQRQLGQANARFLTGDFLEFTPEDTFDVVLAVASAHYLARQGQGADLFRRFVGWLRPGGMLYLYGPRACEERPLRDVGGEWGFRALELCRMLEEAGLTVLRIQPEVEYLGALAKRLSAGAGRSLARRILTYPAQVALTALGNLRPRAVASGSVALLAVASRRPAGQEYRECVRQAACGVCRG